MSTNFKKLIPVLARKENLLILSFLTLAVYGVILQVAEADLKAISGGYGSITEALYFSPDRLYTHLEAYGEKGRSLYRFILLTAGLTARLSFCLLTCLSGLWLQLSNRFWNAVSPLFFPITFLLLSLLELSFILILMAAYPSRLLIIVTSTIFASSLKWVALSGIIISLGSAFLKASIPAFKFRRKAKNT